MRGHEVRARQYLSGFDAERQKGRTLSSKETTQHRSPSTETQIVLSTVRTTSGTTARTTAGTTIRHTG